MFEDFLTALCSMIHVWLIKISHKSSTVSLAQAGARDPTFLVLSTFCAESCLPHSLTRAHFT